MAERPGAHAGDPFGGRQPTSHERMSGQPWDASYQDGPAPWDVGEPQPAFVRLAAEGRFTGYILVAFPAVMFVIVSFLNPAYAHNRTDTTTGQKMLLRMGPANERRLKQKLAELRENLVRAQPAAAAR